jgi:hypothetical protein
VGGAPPLPHDFAPEGGKKSEISPIFGPPEAGGRGGFSGVAGLGRSPRGPPWRGQPEPPRRRGRPPEPRFSEPPWGTLGGGEKPPRASADSAPAGRGVTGVAELGECLWVVACIAGEM